ncbi:MAG: hypothetical protein ACOH5I_19355 [Oligoflexus sp.]
MFLKLSAGSLLSGFLLLGGALAAQAEEQQWTLGLSADYFSNLQGVNPASSVGANAGRKFDDYQLFISQSVVKPYVIYVDENEFNLSDTVIGVSHPLPSWIAGMNFSGSASLSLPLSHYSRRNEIYTKPMLAISALDSLWDGTLNFSYSINARFHLSKFQSEVTGDGRGGRPLPKFSYGASHGGSYLFYEDFTALYNLTYNETIYYSLDPISSEALTVVDLPDQTYAVSFTVNYAVTEKWGASLGLTQGSQIIHAGTTDLVLFDEDLSQWFFTSRYQF